jgi:plastocyanin
MIAQRLRYVSLAAVFFALATAGVVHAQSALTLSAVEFAFQPSTVTTGSGTVSITLRNDGQFPHNLHIDGMANDVFADNLTAGQSATASVSLPPGTYTFWCPVSNHRERGMEGTLTIAGGQAARAGGLDPLTASAGLAVLGVVTLAGGMLRRRADAS